MFKKLLLILALLFSINLYAEHHEGDDGADADTETTETEDGDEASGDEE
jgi:hypothetical protein